MTLTTDLEKLRQELQKARELSDQIRQAINRRDLDREEESIAPERRRRTARGTQP